METTDERTDIRKKIHDKMRIEYATLLSSEDSVVLSPFPVEQHLAECQAASQSLMRISERVFDLSDSARQRSIDMDAIAYRLGLKPPNDCENDLQPIQLDIEAATDRNKGAKSIALLLPDLLARLDETKVARKRWSETLPNGVNGHMVNASVFEARAAHESARIQQASNIALEKETKNTLSAKEDDKAVNTKVHKARKNAATLPNSPSNLDERAEHLLDFLNIEMSIIQPRIAAIRAGMKIVYDFPVDEFNPDEGQFYPYALVNWLNEKVSQPLARILSKDIQCLTSISIKDHVSDWGGFLSGDTEFVQVSENILGLEGINNVRLMGLDAVVHLKDSVLGDDSVVSPALRIVLHPQIELEQDSAEVPLSEYSKSTWAQNIVLRVSGGGRGGAVNGYPRSLFNASPINTWDITCTKIVGSFDKVEDIELIFNIAYCED